jgi:glycosyltransferase involved in cell wall biosynthesis
VVARVKILLGSHHFLPSTGGIEIVTNLLAREFVRRGHEVQVVTATHGDGEFPFRVLRQPSVLQLFAAVKWCDVFVQNNISLRTLWPLILLRRPLLITHQTWIAAPDGKTHWSHAVKRFVLRYATSFAISDAVARSIPTPSIRVGNPYDESVFKEDRTAQRSTDLVFVGRLVSDKGVDLLFDAVALLRESGLRPSLTIIGDGPERAALEQKADDQRLDVTFAGSLRGEQVAALLNQHRILVVPSRWAEPFGIVALEGIACGCVVVGSADGGLPEAIGPCGMTFPNGDVRALADRLALLLRDSARCAAFRSASGAHLAQFTTLHVADLYLDAMTATQ